MREESNRTRTLVVWCPDWPVVTAMKVAGLTGTVAAAAFSANRVGACTAAARMEGVGIGQRRREAQSRCPGLIVLQADPGRDGRVFESVAVLVELLAPGVEVLRPGMIACPARGPARFFGDESRVAEHIMDAVESMDVECRIGIADSLSVAVLAARHSTIVPAGGSAGFCADLPIAELASESAIAPAERAELVDLLQRLGITTFAGFASLPEVKVATRFGGDAVIAHRLAQGKGERTVSRRHIPADLTVEQSCDPPLERVDTAAFAARALADRFHSGLAAAGLACTRLAISAHTENGQRLSRTWRCAAPLTPAATADRLRWQLDGWLTAARLSAAESARTLAAESDDTAMGMLNGPGAITVLKLEPVEAVGAGLIQYGLWGSAGEDDQRASWVLARIQGLLGPESVLTPVSSGGRTAAQSVELVPWGQEKVPLKDPAAPWPGRISAPSPTRLLAGTDDPGPQISILDPDGGPINVSSRGLLTAPPAWCASADGSMSRIIGWAGPWLFDERWWDKARTPVLARLQVCLAAGPPLLLAVNQQGWTIEGVYD